MRNRNTPGPVPKPASVLLRAARGAVLLLPAAMLAAGAVRTSGAAVILLGSGRPVPVPRLRAGFLQPPGLARAGRAGRHHALRHRPQLDAHGVGRRR